MRNPRYNVGIISMQRIQNYGSFMQALSLKKILESLGCKVTFVDYKVKPPITEKFNLKKTIKRKIRNYGITDSLLKKMRGATLFDECYHMLGIQPKRCYHKKVDMMIIGSDEVFNCLQENPDVGYSMELFGKNCRAKRLLSYAASFGDTTEARLREFGVTDEVAGYLKKIDSISVRDENSFNIIKSLTETVPSVHLDPVLVGDVENMEWKDIDNSKFVIVYGYSGRFSREEGEKINEFAHSQGLKTIGLAGEQSFCDENIHCRPDEIISYFKKAEYIVTDTFHGTIFSLICHKKFAVICRSSENTPYTHATNSEKLLDLLTKMDITNKLLSDMSDLQKVISTQVDFNRIDNIRSVEREKTIQYLKNNLNTL